MDHECDAEAFKLARLCRDKGWLYTTHVQTWKGKILVQLCQGGKKMPVGQTKELIEILRKEVPRKEKGDLERLPVTISLSEFYVDIF